MAYVILGGPVASCGPANMYQPDVTDFDLTCFSMGKNAKVLEAMPNDDARINQALYPDPMSEFLAIWT
jgi:hypothetical protein